MALQNTPDTHSKLASRSVKDVFPVSRLVREARVLLEQGFPLLWVEGEISNLAMPASGHIYFSLKDEAAQVRCAMFRNKNRQLRFIPENGMQVLLRVRVTLYENRGEFQLVVEHMEEAGSGALQRAYEALKHRLGEAGLFDETHKKVLPAMPKTVGIISSPDGAAVHDILTVLARRFPAASVILYPVQVQGEGAPAQLVKAVDLAQTRSECDVLIIGRGGGSLEDLWSFNDEKLAYALFQCVIPIVSAVGHEVDFTIADFVADVRAATPSAAAEMVVPDSVQLIEKLQQLGQRLVLAQRQRMASEQRHLTQLIKRLPSPQSVLAHQKQMLKQMTLRRDNSWQHRLHMAQQQVDFLSTRLKHPQAKLENQKHHMQVLSQRLSRQLPQTEIFKAGQTSEQLTQRLNKAMSKRIQSSRQTLQHHMRTLSAVSPLSTLERGYSITTRAEHVVVKSEQVQVGDEVQVQLHQGKLHCEVKDVEH
jgi:exodeoxyribonuclease VII large subunit